MILNGVMTADARYFCGSRASYFPDEPRIFFSITLRMECDA